MGICVGQSELSGAQVFSGSIITVTLEDTAVAPEGEEAAVEPEGEDGVVSDGDETTETTEGMVG